MSTWDEVFQIDVKRKRYPGRRVTATSNIMVRCDKSYSASQIEKPAQEKLAEAVLRVAERMPGNECAQESRVMADLYLGLMRSMNPKAGMYSESPYISDTGDRILHTQEEIRQIVTDALDSGPLTNRQLAKLLDMKEPTVQKWTFVLFSASVLNRDKGRSSFAYSARKDNDNGPTTD